MIQGVQKYWWQIFKFLKSTFCALFSAHPVFFFLNGIIKWFISTFYVLPRILENARSSKFLFAQTCIQSWPISIFCLSCCAGSVTLPIWVFEKQKRCCYTIIIAVSHVHTFYGYNNNCLVDIVTLRLPVYIQLLILKMVSIILYFWMNYWFKDNVFFDTQTDIDEGKETKNVKFFVWKLYVVLNYWLD